MEFINGITFGPFALKGSFETVAAKESLLRMKERTAANFVIFAPAAIQETSHSETIDFTGKYTLGDQELTEMIEYAQSIGLRVAIKPTVNCEDRTWRAFINFFDHDVHCEPKWSNWFRSYTAFQIHFAEIAQKTGCEMFIAGCEMVMTQRREVEWRKLIADIKSVFTGLVSYNTDKYQEEHVAWWDCVDVISSSGYYPITDWDSELDRIEVVVKKFNKPFFFAETGCMSATGSSKVPNDWSCAGNVNLEEQAEWYRVMFEKSSKRDWMNGYGLWDWSWHQYHVGDADKNRGYDIFGKPSEVVVKDYFTVYQ
ncbi:MAG: glycoside hydrolase family 113 [Mobilitalea sp.]